MQETKATVSILRSLQKCFTEQYRRHPTAAITFEVTTANVEFNP